MDKIVERTLLYDFYGELLTDKQKTVFERYYLDDLSLGEISEQVSISRQAVHDTIKKADKQLDKFEEKLKLVEHFVNIRQMADDINIIAKDIKTAVSDTAMTEKTTLLTSLTEALVKAL